ncbi:MAG: DUF2000 domain-containing protein [Proteobacteria bacterium]|nr:DUF2000 domain-containing protein [Pseudomonadota bacterium]
MNFENKLVAVLNKDIEHGVVMNALAHMTIGLGAEVGKELLQLDHYVDANQNTYPNISKIPFIILRAKSNEIRKTVVAAREHSIQHGIFVNTMTVGTYVEQLERTKLSPEESLIYYGCVLFGAWDKVSEITRKFSLWK